MNPYAGDKVVEHLDRVQMIRDGAQPPPVHLQLILSDLCNQDCAFCAYRMSGYTSNEMWGDERNPNRRIEFDKAIEILTDAASMGVKGVQFTGGGEPTIHPRFREILTHCLDLGMEAGIVTNGVKLTPSLAEVVLGATWIRVSLDAAKPETYAQTRNCPEGHYHLVLAHLARLLAMREEEGSTLYAGLGFVVTRDNWREVVDAAKIAKQIGVDNFRISAVFQPDGDKYFDDFDAEAYRLCAEAEALAGDGFTVSNMYNDRLNDLEQGPPDYEHCAYQHFTTYIGADLNVYRCCNTAYSARGLVGSIADRSFRDLWESRVKHQLYRDFDARGCARCQFNDRNRAINRLLAPVKHGAFV